MKIPDIDSSKTCNIRVIIWMNMPSHHQSAFFCELLNQGVDLLVCYYDDVDDRRRKMGWSNRITLSVFERWFSPGKDSIEMIKDWKERIHVVPGHGNRFLRRLVKDLSKANVMWTHWSERSHPGLKWYLSYPVKRWFAHMINRHSIGAFACGNLAADDFIRWGVKREKIAILPYSLAQLENIGSHKTDRLLQLTDKRKVFLYIGSLETRKATDVLLMAFAKIAKSKSAGDWRLVLAGNDLSDGRYSTMAKKLGVKDRVVFLGSIPTSDISSIYKVADVFILPSRFDGWGAVVNEAASLGKALIVSDQCGAAQHIVDPGVNGFVVKAGDWRSLRNAMRCYISDLNLVKEHGLASISIYEKFTPQFNAMRFVKIVHSWLASCRRRIHL